MSTKPQQQAKQIFIELAGKVSQDEWDARIENACGGDRAVREQVQALLRAHIEPGSFLDEPFLAAEGSEDGDLLVSELVGTQIGPYTMRELVGEGGMGVVYVAQQDEPVVRKVALKIIKPGMDSKEVIARFEAEQQALSLMDHPNIARVLDAGTTDSGHPYFVMELVRGMAVTDYCQKHKLPPRERLELFIQLCQAVIHAHQKGIIHRDIKPSNVLVTLYGSHPVPKVIDFGVAKAINQRLTERTLYTRMSQMIGTPLYMSPEQAEMSGVDVDTRTDIYSLGVLLYELLTGTTPFDKDHLSTVGYDELRRIIREEDPPKPSDRVSTLSAEVQSTVSSDRGGDARRMTQLLRGELDWIVMKAIDKDMLRRYDSVGAFADDVQRYLDNEPVVACPPSVRYRLRKFANRNKAVLSTGFVVAAALLVGIFGTSWQAVRATQALKEKEAALQVAEEDFRLAREAVDGYLTRVSEKELANIPLLQPLRKELLELALEYYRKFIAERRDDPDVQAELAAAYYRVAKITTEIGTDDSYGESLRAHNEALDIRKQLLLENPDNENYRHRLAESYLSISELQLLGNHFDEALAPIKAAIATAKPLVKPDHRHTLAKCYLQLAEVHDGIFRSRRYWGRPGDAGRVTRQDARNVLEELVKENPEVPEYQHSLVRSLHQNLGGGDERLANIDRTLTILNGLIAQDPEALDYRVELAESYLYISDSKGNAGDGEGAIANSRKALAILLEAAEKHPHNVDIHHRVCNAYWEIGWGERVAGRLDETVEACQSAIEILTKMAADYPDQIRHRDVLGHRHSHLGQIQSNAGHPEEAIASFLKSIEIMKAVAKESPDVKQRFDVGFVYHFLALAQEKMGERAAAIASHQKGIEIIEPLMQENPNVSRYREVLSECYRSLGLLQYDTGKVDESLISLQTFSDLYSELVDKHPDVDHYRELLTKTSLIRAEYLRKLGRNSEAIDVYVEAMNARPIRKSPAERVSVLGLRNRMFSLILKTLEPGEVEAFFREQLSTWEKLENDSEDKSGCLVHQFDLHHRFGNWLRETQRDDDAQTQFRQALEILEGFETDEQRWLDASLTCFDLYDLRPGVGSEPNRYEARLRQAVVRGLELELASLRNTVEQDPQNFAAWNNWNVVALTYYRSRNWRGADEEARLAVKLASDRPFSLFSIAPLYLLAGNETEYWQMCDHLLDKSDQWSGRDLASAAYMCGLRPSPDDSERLLRLAQRAVNEGPSWSRMALHSAYYRSGESEKAIVGLISETDPKAQLHLAVAHQLAGHQAEAEAWLEKAIRSLEDWHPKEWPAARIEVEVLRQEAGRLILGEREPETADTSENKLSTTSSG